MKCGRGRNLLAGCSFRQPQPNAAVGADAQPEFADVLLREEKPPENHGTPGIYEAVGQGLSLEAGGEVLGYEVLGYEWGGFHSWLCNGLEVDSYREFNIRPNRYGFISNLEEAIKSAEYASREEVGARTGAMATVVGGYLPNENLTKPCS
jgi:hypothetical protein